MIRLKLHSYFRIYTNNNRILQWDAFKVTNFYSFDVTFAFLVGAGCKINPKSYRVSLFVKLIAFYIDTLIFKIGLLNFALNINKG